MNFGLYLLFTLFLFLAFAFWLRGLVIQRLRPERILADLKQEVQTLIADLNQAGDHNISLLEDRVSRLTDLIERADQQIDDARMFLDILENRSDYEPQEPLETAQRADDVTEPDTREERSNEDIPESGRDAVLALYRQGLSADLISARTGVAIGEVELIISLRGKRAWR